jgi:DNA repair exonuclease SbcCD nuclease subunit
MKIGFFSDLHLKQGKTYEFYNKKLIDGIKILDQIFDIFSKKNLDYIFFLGDFFDRRFSIEVPVLYLVSLFFLKWKNKLPPIFFLLGNHDIYKEDLNSVIFLELGDFRVVRKVKKIKLDGKVFTFIPYRKVVSLEFIELLKRNSADFLVIHQLLKGFPVQNGQVISSKENLDYSLVKDYFEWIFSGHNHRPERREKVVSIGAPMKFQFGEEGERGCWIFEDGKLDFIKLEYPDYITIKVEGDKTPLLDDFNYYRILTENPDGLVKKENVEIFLQKEFKSETRLNIKEDWKVEDVMREYVKLKKKNEDFLEFGKKFLEVG